MSNHKPYVKIIVYVQFRHSITDKSLIHIVREKRYGVLLYLS